MSVNCVIPVKVTPNFAKKQPTVSNSPVQALKRLPDVDVGNTAKTVVKQRPLRNIRKVLALCMLALAATFGATSCSSPLDVEPPLNPSPTNAPINPTATPTTEMKPVQETIYKMAKVLFPEIDEIMGDVNSLPPGTAFSITHNDEYRHTFKPTSISPDGKVMNLDYISDNLVTGSVRTSPSTLTELPDGSLEFDWGHETYNRIFVIGDNQILDKTIRKADGSLRGSVVLEPGSLGKAMTTGTTIIEKDLSGNQIGEYTNMAFDAVKKAFKTVTDIVGQTKGRSAFRFFKN